MRSPIEIITSLVILVRYDRNPKHQHYHHHFANLAVFWNFSVERQFSNKKKQFFAISNHFFWLFEKND